MTSVRTLFFIAVVGLCHVLSVAKQCTSQGKFPNDQENSCDGYAMCLIAPGGQFKQWNLTCPHGFIFNHQLSQCTNVTGYQCLAQFDCPGIGNYSDPYNEHSYIACVEGFNDIVTARSIDCPENNTFSVDQRSCVEYVKEHVEITVEQSTENSGYTNSLMSSISVVYCLFIFVFAISFC